MKTDLRLPLSYVQSRCSDTTIFGLFLCAETKKDKKYIELA